jgi:catechol 2,3-dioxygenase-like lactoylglutathione lyase family enzyme
MSVKLDHINITVHNLEESIQWYRKLFGFEKVEGGLNQFGKPWAIVAFQDSMIAMNEYTERKPADTNKDSTTHRMYHFGLRVDDAEAWRAKVQEHRLKLYYGGEVAYPYSKSWYIHDPSGHEIEVSCTDGKAMQFP